MSRHELARTRKAEAIRLYGDGHTQTAIAAKLGVSKTAVHKYLRAPDRTNNTLRADIERLTAQVVGIADASNQIRDVIQDPRHEIDAPDSTEAARWEGDLTQGIRALNQLRTRIKEMNQQ